MVRTQGLGLINMYKLSLSTYIYYQCINMYKCSYSCIDSIFTWIVTRPCGWNSMILFRGGYRGGGAPCAPPPPLKLEKNMIFWVKSLFFTRSTPKIFRASLRDFLKCAPPPNLKSWIRPCYFFYFS